VSAEPALEGFLPGAAPSEEDNASRAAAVRDYMAAVRAHVMERLAGGAKGSEANHLHSDAHDRLIRRLLERAESDYYVEHGMANTRVAVVAVGGYARREMAIGSDIDLLMLAEDREDPFAVHLAERIQYSLWDAGLEVGSALRTIDETVALGQEDESVCTAVLTARFLGGDSGLFHDFRRAISERLIPDPEAFVRSQFEAVAARHESFGESLYLLQPNVKEGAGGLRDYHAAFWVALASESQVRELDDLLHVGLLTESELAEKRAALEFLWRVRSHLHALVGRKTDQMSFEHQEQLAEQLGYTAGDDLPVERFMRDYYRHARAIQGYSEIVMEQILARVSPPRQPQATEIGEDGFRIADDHLEIPHPGHLQERPVRLLTAFAVAQDHEVPLSRMARRFIRENLDLVDDALRSDPEAAATLLRILGAEHRVMRSLMSMNDVGLLGRFLPEWEHIVCRWQHVIYHTYTVDVHSIFLVEELRRLWRGKYQQGLPALTELVHSVPDLPALYLGCLLHDIGKGLGGQHSHKGAVLARTCLERLGIAEDRIARIVFIVEHHLTMSHIAQRRDLSDPKVIVTFASLVGDRENLHNLYLATFADMRASSSSAWTEWRGDLLRELFERTSEYLESGQDDPRRALEQVEARVERRRDAARGELRALGVAEARIDEFFDTMPRRYFVSHTPRQIARHALALFSFGADQAAATAVREMRGGFSELIVCTRDRHGLYADVAGCLTASGINILGANVYTTRTGLALEIYRVSTPPGRSEDRAGRWQRFDAALEEVLGSRRPVAELLRQHRRPVGSAVPPGQSPTRVSVRNDISDFYTVVDITADDRLGLLYDLVRTLSDHELEVYVSKATTVLDQVADTFYLKDAKQAKLLAPGAVEALRRDLLAAAAREAGDG
jgi:[protein-PII] uridylyltransferase